MKCKYCGGDVTLQDHFCPHCGRPVDQAIRHQKEMREYETEFEATKREAINKISVSSGGGTAVGIRLAIIVALIAALIWMLINLNAYDINDRKEKKLANANYDAYVEQIEQYIADTEFMALSRFADKHRLDMNDKYKQYRDIFYASSFMWIASCPVKACYYKWVLPGIFRMVQKLVESVVYRLVNSGKLENRLMKKSLCHCPCSATAETCTCYEKTTDRVWPHFKIGVVFYVFSMK